jgi:hypothetical protein
MKKFITKKHIILALVLILVLVGLSFFIFVTPEDKVVSKERLHVYASSTRYVLLEQDVIVAGEQAQESLIKADQPVMEKYKKLFDE